MNTKMKITGLLMLIIAGYVDAAVPPAGPGERLGGGQPSSIAEIRKINYIRSKYESAWKTNSADDITWIAGNIRDILDNKIATLELFRDKLDAALTRATKDGNIEWVKAAKTLLIKYIFSETMEYDALIDAMEAPQKEAEKQAYEALRKKRRTEKKQNEAKVALKESFKKLLTRSTSEQEYATRLADVYSKLTGITTRDEQASYDLLKELTKRASNVQGFLEYLRDVIGKNDEIMKVVGNEVKMLVSTLLYRIAKSYQDISQEDAMEGFIKASIAKDFGAMINIYRDFLNKSNKKAAIEEAYRMLNNSIKINDTQAIVDLYKHFLKGSARQGDALVLIFDYFMARERIIKAQLAAGEEIVPNESLVRLSAVFAGTAYVPEILVALQSFTKAKAIMSFDLLDEYQAAQVNRDINALRQLRSALINAGITSDLIDAQIISMGGERQSIEEEELAEALALSIKQQAPEAARPNIQERWNAARWSNDLSSLTQLRDEAVRAHVIDPILEVPLDADLAQALIESIQ